jgi:hypothetical protein
MVPRLLLTDRRENMNKDYWTEEEYEGNVDEE